MSWWKHLLGAEEPSPPAPVKDALDAAAAANDSTNRSMRRVRDYWAGRHDTDERLMDEYEQADDQRTRDSHQP